MAHEHEAAADALQNWLLLADLTVRALPRHGDFPAVYALRDSRDQDILKFGNTDRLRRRIFGNYLGGVGGETTKRIHHDLFRDNTVEHVQLAWLRTTDEGEAKRKETELRDTYRKMHGRLPKWDRQA